jgi:gas vesicle protein
MRKAYIGNFLAGLGIGAVVALLLAPQSGKRVRAQIVKATNDGKGAVREYGENVQDAVIAIVDRGKGYMFRQRKGVRDAIKRSVQLYKRAS